MGGTHAVPPHHPHLVHPLPAQAGPQLLVLLWLLGPALSITLWNRARPTPRKPSPPVPRLPSPSRPGGQGSSVDCYSTPSPVRGCSSRADPRPTGDAPDLSAHLIPVHHVLTPCPDPTLDLPTPDFCPLLGNTLVGPSHAHVTNSSSREPRCPLPARA